MISQKYNEQMGNYLAKLAQSKHKLTNADRIRAMTDEELFEEYKRIYKQLPNYSNSWKWLRAWLKEEVEE